MKEAYSDQRALPAIESIGQDIRYALRQMRRSPGFTVVAVLVLALGIGANTAIFSLIHAVMLKMLPVKHPEQLVILKWASQGWPGQFVSSYAGNSGKDKVGRNIGASFSYPAFERLRDQNHSFSAVFAFSELGRVNLVANGEGQLASAQLVSGDYFPALGVRAVAGRTILPADAEPGAGEAAAVLSYGYWQRRFGLNPTVVGQSIEINGIQFTVVGVTQAEFSGLEPGRSVDISIPLSMQPSLVPGWNPPGKPIFRANDLWWVSVMGRLRDGVNESQARADTDIIFRQSLTEGQTRTVYPQQVPQMVIEPGGRGLESLRTEFSRPLLVLMGIVGLVLLIACANVANLLLARALTRQKEIAIRLAIGAGRNRLIRQLLTESVLLSILGGALGVLFAYEGGSILVALVRKGRELLSMDVSPSVTVLCFTAGISLLTGVLFGLAPALQSTRPDLIPWLQESRPGMAKGGGRFGLARALIVAQVALSLILLFGASLFVRTLQNLKNVNTGFNPNHVLLFSLDPTLCGYRGASLENLYIVFQEKIGALPGVKSVGTSGYTFMNGKTWNRGISVKGSYPRPGLEGYAPNILVGPGFFEALQIPIVQGRGVTPSDTAQGPRAAVVNETFVRDFLPGQDAIGRLFDSGSTRDIRIVGVVRDVKVGSLRLNPPPIVYLPAAQSSAGPMTFEVRTAGNPADLVPSVRHVVAESDKRLSLYNIRTQVEELDQSLVQERLMASLSGFFGLLAVSLAAIGLYGVVSYSVSRRAGEIGIRMALGARHGAIIRMIMREMGLLVAIGLGIGILLAAALSRTIASDLYGLTPHDPLSLLISSLVIMLITLLASYLPARTASRGNPLAVLRYG